MKQTSLPMKTLPLQETTFPTNNAIIAGHVQIKNTGPAFGVLLIENVVFGRGTIFGESSLSVESAVSTNGK